MFCHQIYSLFGHLNQVILILSALILILDPTKGNNLLLMILIPTLITSTTIVFLAIVYVCFRRKIVESMNNFSVIYEFFLNQIKNFKDMNPLPFPQGCWKTSKQVQRQIGETEKFQFDKGEAEGDVQDLLGEGGKDLLKPFLVGIVPLQPVMIQIFSK